MQALKDRVNPEISDEFDENLSGLTRLKKYRARQTADALGYEVGRMQALKDRVNPEISDEFDANVKELGYALARIFVCAMMIHHGQEKLIDPATFVKYTLDKQFAFLPGPHLYWAYLIGSIQWVGPIFVGLGVFSRFSAFALVAVMLGAVAQSAMNGLEGFPFFELAGLSAKMKFKVPAFHNYGFETPLLYVSAFLLIALGGPGKFSIAQLLGFNDDKTLLGKLKQ
jgi:uncharacterized membrane protein YphA (DoxX/SURF4 family)